MEFLRAHKRRSLLSEFVYVLLNLGLAAAVLIVTWATGTPWLALVLVILSKWRVLAVRPRYWFAHVEANMVDMLVSVSVVILIYLAGQSPLSHGTFTQVLLALLYAGWLLLLKPQTRRSAVAGQAAIAVVFSSIALASVSYEWPSSLFVLGMWLIGYSTARHILFSYSDSDIRLLSLIWGFIAAELGWVTYHWTIAYSLPMGGGLKLPQLTLLLLGVSFLAERTYYSYHKHGEVRLHDILLPMLLSLGVIAILLFGFSAATIGAV